MNNNSHVQDEIRHTLEVLCEPGQTFEIRAFSRDGGVYSGYSQDFDGVVRSLETLDSSDTASICLTLNPVHPALLARRSKMAQIRRGESTTSDGDIVERHWLPIDLDPVRPAGISSTEEEKDKAREKARVISEHLTELGWSASVVGDSGNGFHLLYRIDLPNDVAAHNLVKGCLEALSNLFSDDSVSVDTSNHNAARIWKLYGTIARKGEDTPDRPHRRSRLVSVPETVVPVDRKLLEDLAAQTKTTKNPAPVSRNRNGSTDFDLADWLALYEPNLPCKVIPKAKSGYRYFYQLDPCPFSNGAHNDGAFLGQLGGGAVVARCHHNSCGNENRWRELRAMGEPGYHDDRSAVVPGDGAKDDDTRILPFFEMGGKLYLDVLDSSGAFGFVHEEDGRVCFDPVVSRGGKTFHPVVLPVHHNSREPVQVVGVPRADLVIAAPLLSPSDLYTILDAHINKYCDMPDRDRELAVYYGLYTWFYVKCPTSPYLRFLGDTGKGKSRLSRVISDLCLYPIKATGSSTTSGLMRFHEKWRGTLVMDESDLRGGKDDPLIKFLNNGFEVEGFIILSDANDPKNQIVFNPFGPKVLAMREPFKDVATEGRCLSYTPYETARRDIPPELSTAYRVEVDELRAIIARFVLHHWQDVDGDKMVEYGDLDIERRLLQMIRPLSVVLQLLPDGQDRFIDYLNARQEEIKRTRSESWEGMLFNCAYSLAAGEEEGAIHEVVAARNIAEKFKTSAKAVTRALQSIGFSTETGHIDAWRDGEPHRKAIRKLVVPSPQVWNEIVQRYWFSEDGMAPPYCPDILRGSRWLALPQKKDRDHSAVGQPLQQPPGFGTVGNDGTEQKRGVGVDQPESNNLGTVQIQVDCDTPSITSVPTVPTVPARGPADELLSEAGLSVLPDIAIYTRITNPDKAPGHCMCKGCAGQPDWGEGGELKNPLCEQHYAIFKDQPQPISGTTKSKPRSKKQRSKQQRERSTVNRSSSTDVDGHDIARSLAVNQKTLGTWSEA